MVSVHVSVADVVRIDKRVGNLADSVGLVVSSSRRVDYIEDQQAAMRKRFTVSPAMLTRIGSSTVHVEPWETAVVYAYPWLNWHPLPVFQDYQAYTPALDQANADYLAGRDRPKYILRQPDTALDDRLPRFDPPLTSLETLCRYRKVDEAQGWQLFEASTNRCGTEHALRTVSARFGETVPVPSADRGVVVARVTGLGDSLAAKLETLFLRGPTYLISPGGSNWFRFLSGTQDSWHLMSVPACAASDISGSGPEFNRMKISNRAGTPSRDERYHVEFAVIPLDCSASSPSN
jgi:hypothetical protein